MDKLQEFNKDLKALLEKYNAYLWIDLDGDTHGVSAHIVVDIDNKEVFRKSDISKYDL